MAPKVAKRQRQPRVDAVVIQAIHALALQGKGNEEIQRALDVDEQYDGRVPKNIRTIRKYANQVRPSFISLPVAASDQWNPAEDRTGNPVLVLAMLRELIEWTSGSITQISHENAARVVTLAPVVQDLTFQDLWLLVVQYEERKAAGEGTDDLDALLALAPWRSGADGWAAYERRTVNQARWDELERLHGRLINRVRPAPAAIVGRLKARLIADTPEFRALTEQAAALAREAVRPLAEALSEWESKVDAFRTSVSNEVSSGD